MKRESLMKGRKMKILITGAKGYLVQGVIPELAKKYQLRLLDFRDMKAQHEFVKCDILDRDRLLEVTQGIDIVFHTAALGGTAGHEFAGVNVQDRLKMDYRYFDINVTGTFNVLQVAQASKVPKVIIVSSEAAPCFLAFRPNLNIVDENISPEPDYIYGLTKYLDEVLCEFFSRVYDMKTVCLRMACFGGPKSLSDMGQGLLNQQGVTRRDMVKAVISAIENEHIHHDVFLLRNSTDFTKEDLPKLRTNPEEVIEKYYRGAVKIMKRYEIEIPKIWYVSDISKAEKILGWRPSFSFREFLENLRNGKYTKDYIFKD